MSQHKALYELLGDYNKRSVYHARLEFLSDIRFFVMPSLLKGPFVNYERCAALFRQRVYEARRAHIEKPSVQKDKSRKRKASQSQSEVQTDPYIFWSWLVFLSEQDSTLAALRDEIIDWARHRNLLYQKPGQYAIWLLDQTLHTLSQWHFSEWYRKNQEWEYTSLASAINRLPWATEARVFKYPEWDMQRQERSAYERITLLKFQLHLRKTLDKLEAEANKKGLSKSPERRNRQWGQYSCRWFTLYQIEEKTLEQIAELYKLGNKPSDKPSHSAVWQAISKFGHTIGLEPRPPKTRRGRPRIKT